MIKNQLSKNIILKKATTLLIFLLLSITIFAAKKNILVLHSYNTGLSWTDEINRGIFESFMKEFPATINIRTEYMDTKNFKDEAYHQFYRSYFVNKYKDVNLDVIICADNNAFNLLKEVKSELNFKIPIVFCGLNYTKDQVIPKGFTGVFEHTDFKANIETILKVHPDYNKIYIINDRSNTGNAVRNQLENTIFEYFPDLRFEYLTDLTLQELQGRLSELRPDDVVLMLLFNFDRLNNILSYDIIMDYLNPYCNVPMYSCWTFYLDQGVVGGRMNDPYIHGIMASMKARQILNGEQVDNIPIENATLQTIFDHKQLKIHGINKNQLPESAKIINQPFGFIQEEKKFYTLLAITMVLLILLVLALALRVKQMKRNLQKEVHLNSIIEKKGSELEKALNVAEQSNALKKQFIANISHEIRTPLNGILGFSQLLSKDSKTENRKNIEIIHACGKQLTEIIDNILLISMIEAEQLEVKRKKVNINTLLRNIVEEFTTSLKTGQSIQIIGKWLPDQDADVLMDEAKLHRILTSLLDNAIKFSHNTPVEFGYNYTVKEIIITVRDFGIGIPQEDHDIIFEQFRKSKPPKGQIYGGNGLGLTISKRLSELMDGGINVESEVQKGTTVTVNLPLKFAGTEKNGHVFPISKPLSQLKVLIVDDDIFNYQLLKIALNEKVEQISYAENGQRAIDYFKSGNRADLVFMDLRMPLVDGFEATRSILQEYPNIKVIAQSAFISDHDQQRAYEAGCIDFFTKPINIPLMMEKLEKLTPRHRNEV